VGGWRAAWPMCDALTQEVPATRGGHFYLEKKLLSPDPDP